MCCLVILDTSRSYVTRLGMFLQSHAFWHVHLLAKLPPVQFPVGRALYHADLPQQQGLHVPKLLLQTHCIALHRIKADLQV